MTSTPGQDKQKLKAQDTPRVPPGCWHALHAVWGGAQKVRLITGPPSLVEDMAHIRSIHIVALMPEAAGKAEREILLVQNKDNSFTFPGGRMEPCENLQQTLKREVWEEARAEISPDWSAVAVTRIEYLNRVPGRIHRFHPMYLLWAVGEVTALSDEPHHDPADSVIGRRLVTLDEAREMLGELENVVLDAALRTALPFST